MNVPHDGAVFLYHSRFPNFPDELSNKSHTNRKRSVLRWYSGTFDQFWSSDAKDTPAYLNGQINGSNGSGCLNLKF